MKTIAIIGAGSHTRSSINILTSHYNKCNFKIYDDSFNVNDDEYIHNIKVFGMVKDIENNANIFLSVGNNKQRKKYFNEFKNNIIEENLFHEISFCENNIKLGISNQIYANAYINSYVNIGDNNIINTSSILEHEVTIGSHNHVSVGAKLCGRVLIGDNCMIGANSVVIDKVRICDNVIIGAGSVVIKDIIESGVYVGNPIRKIK